MTISVSAVGGRADRKAFIELPWSIYADDPNWVPPLKQDIANLIGGRRTNPWFEHARAVFFLARRDGKLVGRISAQMDDLVLERRPGLGQWGMFETIDDPAVAAALIGTAEEWLRAQGAERAQGPMSLSIWDEPGLLVSGFDAPPAIMMGHHRPEYAQFILDAGYSGMKDLHSWELPISDGFPERVNRIVAAGEKNRRIRIREVDLRHFNEEAAIILGILNEAWAHNWGFTPLTDAEVAHVGKKLRPVVRSDLVRIAEYDGEPVAFMLTLPDINELIGDLNGELLPFGWAKLLWRLRKSRVRRMRVPLMGVRTRLQGSRTASLLAFMMIEYIRRSAIANYGAQIAEIGWIVEDNQAMVSIAEAIESQISRTYRVYEKQL